ncbi:transcriptional regulator family: Fungal Specific TF [Penicillium brevicompactum]|uniref:transcriptional regulator family: Fungal Specific TF n=1 Tax=Penicillium brevicompactum TaxID=5074 RepID=UPI00254206EE|nr:transcriptional regulator family: Fungal Specific TF [Penicillium brevicompactum]KAJ5347505.1 transcriptional regulator family: Fungal Specific TF [Penicillium brevicompactum]
MRDIPKPSTSTKRRHHASMACVACRESKVKCDGGDPKCSSCTNKHRECRYQAVDKRKLPLRVAIELLSSRVDQLCLFIRANGLVAPPMSQEKDTALMKVLDVLGLTEVHSNSMPTQEQKASNSQFDIANILNNSQDNVPPAPSADAAVAGEPNGAWAQTSPDSISQTSQTNLIQVPSPHAVSTLPIFPEVEDLDVSVAGSYPPTNDQPDNPLGNLGNWDWTMDFGASLTPPSPEIENLSAEALQIPSKPVEIMPEPYKPPHAQDTATLDKDAKSPEEIEDLIDELSDRVGTLRFGPEGQSYFYGPTSTFNLADDDTPVSDSQPNRISIYNGADFDTAVPTALQDHLLNLYFTWQDPSFHVVDREMFEKGKSADLRKEKTPYYSDALLYAMCSLGAAFETRYHPSFVTFPKSLGEFLGDRAKILLEMELDYPSVSTVQALIILSSYEIGIGSDTRGWLYSGMALRLAFDLALHIDLSSYVARGSVTAADAKLRRTVFWAAYMVDHLVGFYLGRPFYTNMEDVTVKKPDDKIQHQQSHNWTPYGSPIPFADSLETGDCIELVSRQEVLLCELMAPCGYFLYGTAGIPRSKLQPLNEKIVAELLDWKARLPSLIQIDLTDHTTPYLPHVLLLHMQYYQNLIYSHRPWMSKGYLQPQPPKGPGYTHAREMCISSAISIAKILVLYETRYTLRRINVKAVSITSSAVLLLLFAAVSQYQTSDNDNITAHLSTCFRALDEFSLSWQSANRAKDLLVRLQHRWEIRTRINKPDRGPDGTGYPPKKRFHKLNGSQANQGGEVISGARLAPRDLQLESGLGWMLRLSGQLPSDGDEDLYSFVANTELPEAGYEGV